MSARAIAVQKAVLQAVAAAVACPVYDHVPDDAPMPFVELGAQDDQAANTYDAESDDHYLYLEVWSDYRGKKEARDIAQQIHDALDGVSLVLDAGSVAFANVTATRVERDSGGRAYIGSVTVHIHSGD